MYKFPHIMVSWLIIHCENSCLFHMKDKHVAHVTRVNCCVCNYCFENWGSRLEIPTNIIRGI